MSGRDDLPTELRQTPLHFRHLSLGARMVPFAGYDMPVQYEKGIIDEHLWTRARAGLFDISHMGPAALKADDGRHETVARALEALVPADITGLKRGQQRYTQLLNENGGIVDDLMVTRPLSSEEDGTLLLVLNASRKDIDGVHIKRYLASHVRFKPLSDLALIALQGPEAAHVLKSVWPHAAELKFMHAVRGEIGGYPCHICRSGYTGEDGFEISVEAQNAAGLWDTLMKFEAVRPCGLGARDSLRLEAGLCLYGHELDEQTSPIEAGLVWSIQKGRRHTAGFPGAERILREVSEGPPRIRVGIMPAGRAPARDGTAILSNDGNEIGIITSGGYSPSLKRPVAMGYVDPSHSGPGTPVKLIVRGSSLDASIVPLPFVPHAYFRG